MKVAIMQPYFAPYIGYFSLIKQTDKFILFDTVQFINHGWIERNRILNPKDSWQYISVPLIKHNRDTKIKDIKIRNTEQWRELIFSQLIHYKRKAPFYEDTISVLKQAFDIETDSIVKLDQNIIQVICKYLSIPLNLEVLSEMNLKIDNVRSPDEWALNICKALGNVDEYWNAQGGIVFFERKKYDDANIKLKFLKINIEKYPQRRVDFEPGLSIIDVMMHNSPKDINSMLNNFEIL